MAEVLIIAKPLVPPWDDGTKNLARDLAQGLRRHRPRTFGRGVVLPGGVLEPPPAGPLHWLGRLLLGAPADLWHFLFTPNPRTSTVARGAARWRRRPTVQTVTSRPRADLPPSLLFADRLVVLSRATERALRERGVPAERLRRIPPACPPLAPFDEEERRAARRRLGLPAAAPVVVFPGDLETGEGAAHVLDAFAARAERDAVLVMACRPKTARAAAREAHLRRRADPGRVRWVGRTPDIHALLGAADVVALPSRDLSAKVDLPIVLLESQWLARPVIVAAESSAAELAEAGAARVVDGVDALIGALDQLLADAEARDRAGRAARAFAEAHHHPARMAAAYERVYDELLAP